MKNLFRLKTIFSFMLLVSIMSVSLTSCGSDDDDNGTGTTVDKKALNEFVTECESLVEKATDENYEQKDIDAFKTAIADVKTAAGATTLTQLQVDNLKVNLQESQKKFTASAFEAVLESALVMALDFDDANAAELTTTGLRKLKAKLTAGPSQIFGTNTSLPTYVDGVKGGKAIHFAKGSHLAIEEYGPSDFLGSQLSIATWVKTDKTKGGNYVASLNYWNNWKFQVQEQNKIFFTVSTSLGGVDADNEMDNSVKVGEWAHIAVSLDLTKSTLTLFVNGVETKVWNTEAKPNLAGAMKAAYASPTGNQLPLLIGTATTYAEAEKTWTWGNDWKQPANWDHFEGAMDNFAIFNVSLNKGQVAKLYNTQKAK